MNTKHAIEHPKKHTAEEIQQFAEAIAGLFDSNIMNRLAHDSKEMLVNPLYRSSEDVTKVLEALNIMKHENYGSARRKQAIGEIKKVACNLLLAYIEKQFSIGPNDTAMKEFIEKTKQDMDEWQSRGPSGAFIVEKNEFSLTQLRTDLVNIALNLAEDEPMTEIRATKAELKRLEELKEILSSTEFSLSLQDHSFGSKRPTKAAWDAARRELYPKDNNHFVTEEQLTNLRASIDQKIAERRWVKRLDNPCAVTIEQRTSGGLGSVILQAKIDERNQVIADKPGLDHVVKRHVDKAKEVLNELRSRASTLRSNSSESTQSNNSNTSPKDEEHKSGPGWGK